MDGGGTSKDGERGVGEVKYRGVQKRQNGKFTAKIRDYNNRNGAESPLGTYAMAEEAARAYDRAAYEMRGHMAVLNFPAEYPSTFSTAAYNASTLAATAGAKESSSSGNVQGREGIEIKYSDDKLVELKPIN